MKFWVLGWFASGFCFAAGVPSACPDRWEVFSSKPYEQTAYPETNVTYRRYRFVVPEAYPLALKITGRFPYARYMGFNLYDQSSNPVGNLGDPVTLPDEGSLNPFRPGADRKAPNRDYTLWVFTDEPSSLPTGTTNVLVLPKDRRRGRTVELWYRVYSPDDSSDPLAGVGLPLIQAFRQDTLEGVDCPAIADLPTGINISNFDKILPMSGREVSFYHSSADSVYANGDATYLASRIQSGPRSVVVLRFLAPTFANTKTHTQSFPSETEVRYWSLCSGGATGKTSGCLADYEVTPDKSGYVTLVVGDAALASKVKEKGVAFLAKGKFTIQFLLYRNLLPAPDFAGLISKVPKFPDENHLLNDEDAVAHLFIGERAPRGVQCTTLEFLKGLEEGNLCGLSLPVRDLGTRALVTR